MADKRITDVDYLSSLDSNESFFVNQNNSIKQINKSNIVFDITNGGTGASTVAGARNALGLGNTSGELPIANGGTGATTAEKARVNLGAVSMITKSVSLEVSSWSSNTQTVSVEGVTASNTVIISPAPTSIIYYGENNVRCTAQGMGTLTFQCDSVPSVALTVNAVILT